MHVCYKYEKEMIFSNLTLKKVSKLTSFRDKVFLRRALAKGLQLVPDRVEGRSLLAFPA